MSSYFEYINENDGRVVLDDRFQNFELVDVKPLSQCAKWTSGYVLPAIPGININTDILVHGITLVGLSGKQFCMNAATNYDGTRYLCFYNPAGQNVEPVYRDDIAAVASIYTFAIWKRPPAEHLSGVELYNEAGNVVYSSGARYMDVIHCGTDAATVPYDDSTLAIPFGEEKYVELRFSHRTGYYGMDSSVRPAFTVNANTVSITARAFTTYYTEGFDDDDGGGRQY